MTSDSADRWMRIKDLFCSALEAANREVFLSQLTGSDVALIGEVRRLLELHDTPGLAVDSPIGGDPQRYRSGDRLSGRYTIRRFLASGGMGEVYEALDETTGQPVALKFINALAAGSPSLVARLRREVELLRRIDHPNVCRVAGFGDHDGERFCIMELLEGETLAARLSQSGPLSPHEAASIAAQLCDALTAAHVAGVIHRDLKPGNVFLERDRVVVIDFGLAAAAIREESLTPPSAVIGTLAYMAPEQLEGASASVQTDIFALGVVLYEMLTGRKPHSAKSPFRLAAQKAQEAHSGIAVEVPGLPMVWDEVIARCLKADPAARFSTAADVKLALVRKRPTVGYLLKRQKVLLPLALALVAVVVWLGWSIAARDRTPLAHAARLHEQARAALIESSPYRSAQLLEQSVAADSDFLQAFALLAIAYVEGDQVEKAREAVLRATAVVDRRWKLGRGERLALDAARATVMRDFAGAVASYERLVAVSHGSERIQAMMALGRAQAQAGKADAAVGTFESVLKEAPSNAAARTRLGALLARRGNFRRASDEFARAEQEYRARGNLEGLADLLLARAGSDRTRPPEGDQKDLDEVVAIANRLGSAYYSLSAQFGLYNLSVAERDFDRAVALMQATVREAQNKGLPTVAARAQSELGYTYVYLAQHERAIAPLQQALDMAERSGSLGLLASTQMRLGEALAALNRNDEAVATMRPAIHWYRQGGFEEELPMMLIKWGTAYAFGRAAEKIAIFEEALHLSLKTGNQAHQALAMQRLGSHFAAHDLRKASELFRRLVPLARQMGHLGAIAQAAVIEFRYGNDIARGESLFREVNRALESYPKGQARDLVRSILLGHQAEASYILGRCEEGLAHFAANPRPTMSQRAMAKRLAVCAGRSTHQDVVWATAAGERDPEELLAASQVVLYSGDRALARRLAERAEAGALTLRNFTLELEAVLLERAAEGTGRLTERCLNLARRVGFDPPAKFGGRRDLSRLWELVRESRGAVMVGPAQRE